MQGDLYHIFNRGIRKSKIYRQEDDYLRFVFSLYKFNNKGSALRSESKDLNEWPKQDRIVEILKWALLPNHYHLLVQEAVEGGVSEFVKRLGNGYTKYVNIKYKESGYLFQNEAQKVLIESDSQYLYIPYYVELNPLDIEYSGWKNSCVGDVKGALEFVNNYKWSSLRNYAGITSEFEQIINKERFYEIYDISDEEYKAELRQWIENIPELENFGGGATAEYF